MQRCWPTAQSCLHNEAKAAALTGVWGNLTDLQLAAWTSHIRREEEKGLRMRNAGWEQCQLWSTSLRVSMWGWQRAKQHSEKKRVGLQNFTGSTAVPPQSKEMCSSPQSMGSLYDGCLDAGADWSHNSTFRVKLCLCRPYSASKSNLLSLVNIEIAILKKFYRNQLSR